MDGARAHGRGSMRGTLGQLKQKIIHKSVLVCLIVNGVISLQQITHLHGQVQLKQQSLSQ